MSIRHWHGVHMTSRDHSKVVSMSYFHCGNSYYLRNCSTYNSPLCLRSNNIKSVFDSVIIVVVVTPYPFQKQPPEVLCKNGVLRNFTKFTGKHLCQRLFFNKVAGLRPEACNFIEKESLAQLFPCEFCEISKNTFFAEHLRATGFAVYLRQYNV